MKTLSLSIVLILAFLGCHSSVQAAEPQHPPQNYEGVVDVPQMSASAISNLLEKWLSANVDETLETESSDNTPVHTLRAQHSLQSHVRYRSGFAWYTQHLHVAYQINIEVREGAYRYVLSDFAVTEQLCGECDDHGPRKPVDCASGQCWSRLKKDMDAQIEALLSNMTGAVTASGV